MEEIKQLDEQAEKLKKEGNYVQALQVVEEALSVRKEHFEEDSSQVKHSYRQLCELCNILATQYLQKDQNQLAFDLLKRAEMLCERDEHAKTITFNNYACYYRKVGKARISMNYLNRALALESGNPNTHLNLCAVLSQIKKHEKAAEHAMMAVILLQEMFILSKDDTEETASLLSIAYHNLAVEFEYLKRTEESLSFYKKAADFAAQHVTQANPVVENVSSAYEKASKDFELTLKKKKKRIVHKSTGSKISNIIKSPQKQNFSDEERPQFEKKKSKYKLKSSEAKKSRPSRNNGKKVESEDDFDFQDNPQ